MRKNSENTPSLELHTHADDFYDSTLVWVCAETCAPYLKDVDQLQDALNELGYEGIALFDEDLQDREDVTSCIEIVESFSQPISQLLHKLNLDGNTVIFLSADENAALLGTRVSDFKIPFDNADVHGTIVHCNPLYTRLNHSTYGLQRETLITIAHELGHAYTGDIYDEDGDLAEAEDHHGPDEEEVEAFGREWADLVLGNASEAEIDAVISKFKADIERLKLAIESGEIDPYDRERPNPSREWFETQGRQNEGGISREYLKRIEYRDRSQRLKGVYWMPFASSAYADLETSPETIVNYIYEHVKDIAQNLDEEGSEDSEIRDIERDMWSEDPVYLEYIDVGAKARGKGLGSILMPELEALLVQEGFDTVYLVADPVQRSAWYMRLGYSPIYPTDPEDFEKAGVVVMKKDIKSS